MPAHEVRTAVARIRSIKPDFFTDEQLTECSVAACFLYIGLWVFSDDIGYMSYSPRRLAMQIFPHRAEGERIGELIAELQPPGCVFAFELDRRQFLYLPKFLRHQKIDKPSAARYCTLTHRETGKAFSWELPAKLRTLAREEGQEPGEVFLITLGEESGSTRGVLAREVEVDGDLNQPQVQDQSQNLLLESQKLIAHGGTDQGKDQKTQRRSLEVLATRMLGVLGVRPTDGLISAICDCIRKRSREKNGLTFAASAQQVLGEAALRLQEAPDTIWLRYFWDAAEGSE